MKDLDVGLIAMFMLIAVGLTQPCFAQDVIPGTEFASIEAIPPAPDGESRAYYEAATGRIHVTVGPGVLILSLEGAPLILENRNSDTPLGEFSSCECSLGGISQLDFGGLELEVGGPYDFGNLLPADPSIRTARDFEQRYPDAIFRSGAPGVPSVNSQYNVIPIAIPEPASGALWLVTTLGWLSRRRR